LNPLDRQSAHVHRLVFPLAEVLLAEVFLARVPLVAEGETVLVVSEFLEKRGTILPGSVTLEEKKALLFFDASLGT